VESAAVKPRAIMAMFSKAIAFERATNLNLKQLGLFLAGRPVD